MVASDASMSGNKMVTHWMLVNTNNLTRVEGGVESTRWEEAIIPQGEGIRLLDTTKNIVEKTKCMQGGEITAYNDNKFILKGIDEE